MHPGASGSESVSGAGFRLVVDRAPVAHLEHLDDETIILDYSEHAVRPNSVAPFSSAVRRETLAERAGVDATLQVPLDPAQDKRRVEPVHLLELLLGGGREFDAMAHSPSSDLTHDETHPFKVGIDGSKLAGDLDEALELLSKESAKTDE